jgi:hypothetical protein
VSVVIVDDHLLGDIIGVMIPQRLSVLLRRNDVATTNLYYFRLCRAALAGRGGVLTGSWSLERRQQAIRSLLVLPPDIGVVPMQTICFRMAELARDHHLSALGAEAVAAAEASGGPLCVWEGDDGPNIRSSCSTLGVRYSTISREK